MTDPRTFYVVRVDDDGDVFAYPAKLHDQPGPARLVLDIDRAAPGLENQGGDAQSMADAARDALMAVMPEGD